MLVFARIKISVSAITSTKQKCHLENTGVLESTSEVDEPQKAALAIKGLYICVINYIT